jgi:hypothetical protein
MQVDALRMNELYFRILIEFVDLAFIQGFEESLSDLWPDCSCCPVKFRV